VSFAMHRVHCVSARGLNRHAVRLHELVTATQCSFRAACSFASDAFIAMSTGHLHVSFGETVSSSEFVTRTFSPASPFRSTAAFAKIHRLLGGSGDIYLFR
jgi:hypothetical protein